MSLNPIEFDGINNNNSNQYLLARLQKLPKTAINCLIIGEN